MASKGFVFCLLLSSASLSAAPRSPRSSRFGVERLPFRERYTSRKEKDHSQRSFTTMGVLRACLANRHSRYSDPCLQVTDGCSSDPTGGAKASVPRWSYIGDEIAEHGSGCSRF